MQKGGRKFSFSRFILNSFPNFANDDPNDVDLSPQHADDLVQHQLSQPAPRYLSDLSFFVAHITDNRTFSRQVHKALLKAGIIGAAPTSAAESSSSPSQQQQQQQPQASAPRPVTTSAIGKKFVSQVPNISVHAQRKLVGMLFFWEEECTRWALLDQEEAEILMAIEHHQGVGTGGEQEEGARAKENADLDLALRAVEMKRKLLPSQRAEHTANVGQGVGFSLPAYA